MVESEWYWRGTGNVNVHIHFGNIELVFEAMVASKCEKDKEKQIDVQA